MLPPRGNSCSLHPRNFEQIWSVTFTLVCCRLVRLRCLRLDTQNQCTDVITAYVSGSARATALDGTAQYRAEHFPSILLAPIHFTAWAGMDQSMEGHTVQGGCLLHVMWGATLQS